jgi:hypothetical protein
LEPTEKHKKNKNPAEIATVTVICIRITGATLLLEFAVKL